MSDLRELLRTHQATVYTICFQVLRRAHDAEDAAQEALLEIARGIGTLREPRALKRWICRLALHTALDHRRRRDRRIRHEEARAAMNRPTPDPVIDAVHDALSILDDRDRCLLVERYFERATLEEIAARDGVSAAAVSKRVEHAKEKLKGRLGAAGLAAFAPRVDSALESRIPMPPIPDLVGDSQVLSALTIAGGAAVGTKIALSSVALVAVLCLVLGAGSGYVVGIQRAPRPIEASTAPRASILSPEPLPTMTTAVTPAPLSDAPPAATA